MNRAALIGAALLVSGCSALTGLVPDIAYTPIDAQVGKENTQNTVGKQENIQGDSSNTYLNTSTGFVAGALAGAVISAGTALPFVYLLTRRRKKELEA